MFWLEITILFLLLLFTSGLVMESLPENICSFKGSFGPSGSSPESPIPQWYHRPFATNVHAQRFRGSEPHLILIEGGSIMIPTTWMKKLSLRAVNCSIQAHSADRTSTDLPSLDLWLYHLLFFQLQPSPFHRALVYHCPAPWVSVFWFIKREWLW